MKISSKIYNDYLMERGGVIRRQAIRFMYLLLRRHNLIISTEVNGQTMKLPFTHMLPFFQRKYENYDRQLGRICKKIYEKSGVLSVIDIGANIGDTIVNIGIKDAKYLAVEGENTFFNLLKENTKEYNVFYENVFLTDNSDRNYKAIVANGTANLIADHNNEIETTTLDCLMKMKYKNFKADILKIDTDGFDFKVIRGGGNYIASVQPIIFFEWTKKSLILQGEDGLSIFKFLENLGYEDIALYDNFGNEFLTLKSSDLRILESLLNYTECNDKRIHYYDVLAIHKDTLFLET